MVLTGYPIEDLALRASFVRRAAAGAGRRWPRGCTTTGSGTCRSCWATSTGATRPWTSRAVPKGSPQDAVAVLHGGTVVATPGQAPPAELRRLRRDPLLRARRHARRRARARRRRRARDLRGHLAGRRAVAAAAEAGAGLLLVRQRLAVRAGQGRRAAATCAAPGRRGRVRAGVRQPRGRAGRAGLRRRLAGRGRRRVGARRGRRSSSEQLLVVDLDLPAAGARRACRRGAGGCGVRRTVLTADPVDPYEPQAASTSAEHADDVGEVWRALVLGLRDYVRKNGFRTRGAGPVRRHRLDRGRAAGAATRSGRTTCTACPCPSAYSTEHSRSDAAELARAHRPAATHGADRRPMVDAYEQTLPGSTGWRRRTCRPGCRAVALMALSNRRATWCSPCGNKSELAVGYTTIYGDAVGGYAPLKDVPKTLVWELARWRNADAVARGESRRSRRTRSTSRRSAELRPDQLDTDSLPDYELLDDDPGRLRRARRRLASTWSSRVRPRARREVMRLVDRAECKRRQYPPGPKISIRKLRPRPAAAHHQRLARAPPLTRVRVLVAPSRALVAPSAAPVAPSEVLVARCSELVAGGERRVRVARGDVADRQRRRPR